MGDWSYKRDATGRLRRFPNQREVTWWALTGVGEFFGLIFGYAPILTLYRYFTNAPSLEVMSAAGGTVFAVVLWLIVSGVIYLHVVLSGGVMSRDERSRLGREGS